MSFSLCLRVALLISLPAMPLAAQNADWRSYNGSLDGMRYSTLDQITAVNASSLRQVCSFDTGENMSMQNGPVVIDGRLYFTTDTSTYAIDAATCEEIWHTARSYEPLGFLGNNHGVAYLDGRLFRVHGGVHAYALDAETGEVLWDVDFREHEGESAPMAPLAWDGLVFVGNAGGDNIGVEGHVHALDAETGREVLHEADTGAPIGAGIVTYAVDGNQYIAVAGGSISPIGPLEEATSRVTVFGLR